MTIEPVEHGEQRRQVAPHARKEVIAHFRRKRKAEGPGAVGERLRLLLVAQGMHSIDEAPAEPRHQILAQRELHRGRSAACEERAATLAHGIKKVKRGLLRLRFEPVDVIERHAIRARQCLVHLWRCRARDIDRIGSAAALRRDGGAQEMGPAAAALSPQVQQALARAGDSELAQALEELCVPPRDEIVENRRGRRGEIKRKLFHVSSGSERSGSSYGKIRLTPDRAEDIERQHGPVVTAGCAHILAQIPVPPSKRKRPSAHAKRRTTAIAPGARKGRSRPALNYRAAGVDIDAGDRLVENIKPFAKKTLREGVLAGIGGFGALFQIARDRYREPVLVSGTDGVGTKLKLAFELNRHGTIGIDLVAMSVNDILTHGAEPLFFLDYFACGRLDVATATEVVRGIAEGCASAGCALIGGETAEMPGMYPTGEYDLAGFAVGIVEKSGIIDGSSIAAGDVVLGLASSGAHSNGYSLIRKIIAVKSVDLSTQVAGRKLSELILEPTRIYVKPVLKLIAGVRVKGLAHITGGGIVENVPRVLPEALAARIERRAWAMPALFRWLQDQGNITDEELFRVFNCGIGMAIVVSPRDAARAMQVLRAAGETAWAIGRIEDRAAGGPQVILV